MSRRIPSCLMTGVALVIMLCMAVAMGVVPRSAYHDPDAPRRREAIHLPDLRDQLESLADASATYIHQAPMQRGDTVAALHRRLVDDPDAQQFIPGNPAARALFQLQPGQVVLAEVDQDNLLVSLRASVDGNVTVSRELVIQRAGEERGFKASVHTVRNELRYEMRSGIIADGGFFKTMDVASVSEEIVRQMASIFSGVVDFHHDIIAGDRFRIVYESGFRDGAFARNGRVVAVEFLNRSQLYQALWYADGDSNAGTYYTFDGRTMARPFLRSPVEFSRMSPSAGAVTRCAIGGSSTRGSTLRPRPAPGCSPRRTAQWTMSASRPATAMSSSSSIMAGIRPTTRPCRSSLASSGVSASRRAS